MSSTKNFSTSLQKKIGEKLSNLPKIDTQVLSKLDLVAGLKKDIELALSNGYSWLQIADFLKEDGVEISPATLKTYSQKRKATKKAPAKRAGIQPPPTPQVG